MALIVIVGAGIAGLSAALALADFGDVIVLERRGPEAANSGAGIQLSPNAMKALSALGTAERVATVATGARCAGDGERPAHRPAAALQARHGGPLRRAVLHRRARRTPWRADRRRHRARDRHPLRRAGRADHPRAGRQSPAGDRPPGGSPRRGRRGPLALRGALAGDGPRDTGWTAWRGIGSDAAANETDLVLGTGHHLVRYALSNAQENCVLITRDPKGPGAVRGDAATMMADVARWTPWPIKVMPRHVFHGAGVAFVGDAAHAMLPFLAQGGAMALEDAVALGAAVPRARRRHGGAVGLCRGTDAAHAAAGGTDRPAGDALPPPPAARAGPRPRHPPRRHRGRHAPGGLDLRLDALRLTGVRLRRLRRRSGRCPCGCA